MVVEAAPAAPTAPLIAPASGLRRIAAWLIDYFLVAIYLGVVVFVAFLVTGGTLEVEGLSGPGSRQFLAALTMTLPVLFYFAISEASCWHGSVGKRATRLEVADVAGRPIGILRSLLRSALKLLPFELASTFVHRLSKTGDIPWTTWAFLVLALGLSAIWVAGLFLGRRGTLYDVLSGTRVVRVE